MILFFGSFATCINFLINKIHDILAMTVSVQVGGKPLAKTIESSLQVDSRINRAKTLARPSTRTPSEYRDAIYMKKDILLRLSEHGELNQSTLLGYCGLNLTKHKVLFDSLERKGFIKKTEIPWGSKKMIRYSITSKGAELFKIILEPYEEMFPRKQRHDASIPDVSRD